MFYKSKEVMNENTEQNLGRKVGKLLNREWGALLDKYAWGYKLLCSKSAHLHMQSLALYWNKKKTLMQALLH